MKSSSEMLSSPLLPLIDGKDLSFQPDWLQPTEHDFHSRSRVQCILLSFYQSTILFLSHSTPEAEHPNGKRFFDQLKLLVSLDINQAPPLRIALGWLWKAYLTVADSSTLMTAASWLLDQLRSLIGSGLPLQTSVFIQITSAVFISFGNQLGPFKAEYYKNLIKLSTLIPGKESIAIVASQNLLQMIKVFDDSMVLGDLKAEIIGKIVPALLSSNVSDLQSSSAQILSCYYEQGNVNLGYLNRKSIKASVEKLFDSHCKQTKDAAVKLMSKLISSQPNGKPQTIEKFIKSWINTVLNSSLGHEDFARILVCSPLFKDNMSDIVQQIVSPRELSLPIIPESKKKRWNMEPKLFYAFLAESCSFFIQTPRNFVEIFAKGHVLGESLMLTFLEFLFGHVDIFKVNSELMESIVECTKRCDCGILYLGFLLSKCELTTKQKSNLISFLYAQAKMEYNLYQAADLSSQICKLNTYLMALAGIIVAGVSDPINDMADLFESSSLLSEIRTWSLSLVDKLPKSLKTSLSSLMGALSISTSSLYDGKDPDNNNTALLCYYLFRECSKEVQNFEGLSDFLSCLWKSYNSLESFQPKDQVCIKLLIVLTEKLHRASTEAASFCTRVISGGLLPELEIDLCEILATYFDFASFASQKYHLGLLHESFSKKTRQESIFNAVVTLVEHLQLEGRSQDDVKLVLSLLADMVFPFVPAMDENIVYKAGRVLVKLINISSDTTFGTAIFEELMQRSLNEENDLHRRGYVSCIGHVYSCIGCTSHFDINATVGFLSSMCKDSNGTVVRMAALSSLSQVLRSYSTQIEYSLTSDVIYLIWHIYMEDENPQKNLSCSLSNLTTGIEKVLLVLYELLGGEVLNGRTSSLICRMILWSLLARCPIDCADQTPSIFDCYIKLLVLSHEIDDFSLLLRHLSSALVGGRKAVALSAISCLRWLLVYYPKDHFSKVAPLLLFSLLRLNIQCQDLDFCVDILIKNGMKDNPTWWINKLQDFHVNPARTIEKYESINDEKPLVHKRSAIAQSNLPLPMDTLCRYLRLIKDSLLSSAVLFKDDEASNELMASSLRLAHSFLLRFSSSELKILGIQLISVLTDLFSTMSTGSSFLKPYSSQIMTFYSASLQDEEFFVMLESLSSFTENISKCRELRTHGKCKQIVSAATRKLVEFDNMQYASKQLEIYLKCRLATNLLQCSRILQFEDIEKQVCEASKHFVVTSLTNLPNVLPAKTTITEILNCAALLDLSQFSDEEKLNVLFLCANACGPSVSVLIVLMECAALEPMASILAKRVISQIIKDPSETLLCLLIENIQKLQNLTGVCKEMLLFSLLESAQSMGSLSAVLKLFVDKLDLADIRLLWSVFFDLFCASFVSRRESFAWIFDRNVGEKLTETQWEDLYSILLRAPIECYTNSLREITSSLTTNKLFSLFEKKLEMAMNDNEAAAVELWRQMLMSADLRQRECAIACLPSVVKMNSVDMELISQFDIRHQRILNLLLTSAHN